MAHSNAFGEDCEGSECALARGHSDNACGTTLLEKLRSLQSSRISKMKSRALWPEHGRRSRSRLFLTMLVSPPPQQRDCGYSFIFLWLLCVYYGWGGCELKWFLFCLGLIGFIVVSSDSAVLLHIECIQPSHERHEAKLCHMFSLDNYTYEYFKVFFMNKRDKRWGCILVKGILTKYLYVIVIN